MPEAHFRLIRKRMFLTTLLLSLGVMLAFTLAAYSFYTAHAQSKRERELVCTAQNRSNDALRKVLILAQSLAASRKDSTPEERQAAADFYGRALHLVGHVPCQGKGS